MSVPDPGMCSCMLGVWTQEISGRYRNDVGQVVDRIFGVPSRRLGSYSPSILSGMYRFYIEH